ncbi:antitoxin [Alphaproteobacteria bacterium]|nr:antitoxin [Alphaproteobacteria bacterium]
MESKYVVIIEKIVAYMDKIAAYVGDADQAAFLADTKLIEACVFNMLQMGELAGRLDENFRKARPDIPWQKIRGLRNKIAHDYEGVRLDIIWDIVKNDLGRLRGQLAALLLQNAQDS